MAGDSETHIRHADVVVVGAGLAGLTAAWRLAEAGASVAVVEARERVGGRLSTVVVDGEAFELGGQWIGPTQSAVRALLGELGLELFQRHRAGDTVRLTADGRAVRQARGELGLDGEAAAAYEAGLEQLRRLVDAVDPEEPWTHPDARALDARSYEQWLHAEVPHPDARSALRFIASGFMTKPADTFSLLQAAWLLSSAGAVEHLLDEDEVLDARVVGGAQEIAVRLAERLGDRVLLGAPVRDLAWSADAVRIGAGAVELTARAAVLAVPPNLLPAIRFDPPLPGRRMQADQWLSQGALIKVQAAYATPFWRAEGLSGTAFGETAMVSEVYDNSPPSGTPGVLIGFLSDHAADAAAALFPAARRAAVLDSFAAYFGPAALAPTHYVEHDWSTEEWTRGAYSATFAIGALSRFGAVLREPIGPLRFAGSDIAGTGTMHMDGAVRSGEAAAASLVETLALAPRT